MLRNLAHFSTTTNDAKTLNANISVTNVIWSKYHETMKCFFSGRFRMSDFKHCNRDKLIKLLKRA